jgi:ArsR family transcriptional regulator, arsenate/arsenite/antimonite-responsive transcriptional repressor
MESKEAVGVLAALAQDTRLAIFRHLVQAGGDGVPAGSIAASLEVPGPTLSFHLKELEHAGVVTSRRESRLIYYSANYAGMRALIDFLTEDCCNGHPEVCFASKRSRVVGEQTDAVPGCRPAGKRRRSRS